MKMDDPKALALFQEILKKTLAGKFAWQPTAEDDKYIAPMLGKFTLTLLPYTYTDNWGVPQGPPTLTLTDADNKTMVEMNNNVTDITAADLQALLLGARRIALKTDDAIDELIQELQREE